MSNLTSSGQVLDTPLAEALSQRYLAYALSTITARSLPDVRDGLKPVHRRLLYAMRVLKLNPGTGFKKCARVVGDVIGKYHPHGDQAVYDALVRLAQEFSARYPLVDGQGNFGNIDGDGAAAMRYTEARLTSVAEALLQDIDQGTVDFRSTYDGGDKEPVVLPARFPNLLANGASGIAVGMATNIPPHNVGEICEALIHLLRHPNAKIAKLIGYIPGPDFPTGGVLVEPHDSVVEAYSTGRGSFRLRAHWQVEDVGRGHYQIVVSEIPYQVNKSRLIEKIADLISEKKLSLLGDVRDESAEEVRLVLEPRSRSIDAEVLMEMLFRMTDLEVRIGLNMNVLDYSQTPRVMSLREVLLAFIEHRLEVLLRRSRDRLARIENRLKVIEGYLIVYQNLDEIIRIIREEDEPSKTMSLAFRLTDIQVEAILNMRLRALRRLEEVTLTKELVDLNTERKVLKDLVNDKKRQITSLNAEFKNICKSFGSKYQFGIRRTRLSEIPQVEPVELETLREPITIVCSKRGWIRALKGHAEDNGRTKYKEGDRGRYWLHANTADKLIIFGTNGRFYTLLCDKLSFGRSQGEPLRLLIDLGNNEDIVAAFVHIPGRELLIAASDGRGFIVSEDIVIAQTRAGKQVLNVGADVEARVCVPAEGDCVAVVGENRKLLLFSRVELPEMTRGRGVMLQRYRECQLRDAKVFKLDDGLTWKSGKRTRTEVELTHWLGKRGQAGRKAPRGFPKINRFSKY